MNALRTILALAALLTAVPASAQIYRWTDADGRVHFSNRPPTDAQAEHVTEGPPRSPTAQKPAATGAGAAAQASSKPQAAATNRRVVMYSTAWCGYCRKARDYFNANRIAFTEYDVEANPQAMAEFRERGGRGYPLIFVGSERMDGFSQARLEQLLRRN